MDGLLSHATNVLRLPAKTFLAAVGITARESVKGDVTWFNLDVCPICNKSGFQCGLSESFDVKGRSVKGFKCQHTGITDARPFYSALGYWDGDAKLNLTNRLTQTVRAERRCPTVDDLPGASDEALAVHQKRLRENQEALKYLFDRGLTISTIEHFRLGLSKRYRGKEGFDTDNCLIFPLINSRGLFVKKNAYYNIPGVTLNPKDENGWMAGAVASYYAGNPNAKILLVCEGAKDVWRVWQEILGTPLQDDLLLITSTHGSCLPKEWEESAFWQGFDQVFLGQDADAAGENIVAKMIKIIGIDARRLRVPKVLGKDWTDFFQNGGTVVDFQKLMADAPPATMKIEEEKALQLGLLPYNPVDINGSFHGGHLHYTVRALERKKGRQKNEDGTEDEVIQEALQTVVVRSDGAILSARPQPIMKGAAHSQQVLRLTDGTLIARMPTPSPYASWSWPSIRLFHEAKRSGKELNIRPLAVLVRDVLDYIKSQVWLPHLDDYVILALGAVVTYVQNVFDAVPLFLVSGPKGSGKTELGRAMRDVCCNATMVGQASAATIARLIDMTRGFVVLDDLESIGTGKVDAQFSELIQALKLSYKKDTSKKLWTEVRSMKVEELNFFGVKMINNTTGVDSILGSRMLVIHTRKRLQQEAQEWDLARLQVAAPPEGLRDELHTWAFEKCRDVAAAYQRMYSQGSDRADEIAAPLRVIAELSGDEELLSALEAGLTRQAATPKSHEDPADLLAEAATNLVVGGYRALSVQHVLLEMLRLTPGRLLGTGCDTPEWGKPEWIGRQLRAEGIVHGDGKGRVRVQGMNLRYYEIAPAFVASVAADLEKQGGRLISSSLHPDWFCQDCEGCQYRNVGCSIMFRRQESNSGNGNRKKATKPVDRNGSTQAAPSGY